MLVSRLATVALFFLSVLVTLRLETIEGAWRIVIALGAGTGLVFICAGTGGASARGRRSAAALVAFGALTGFGVFDPADPLEGVHLMPATTARTTVA